MSHTKNGKTLKVLYHCSAVAGLTDAFSCFSFLVLSLWTAKQTFLQLVRTVVSAGWSGLRRMFMGRFSDVGSRINCVRCTWLGFARMLFVGKYWDMVLSRSGMRPDLVSAVALHLVSRWTMSSVGVGCPCKRD